MYSSGKVGTIIYRTEHAETYNNYCRLTVADTKLSLETQMFLPVGVGGVQARLGKASQHQRTFERVLVNYELLTGNVLVNNIYYYNNSLHTLEQMKMYQL